MTPYDSDIRVPLIVVGPGVPQGAQTKALSENIDLAPTFMRMAGARPPGSVDGRTLLPILHGNEPASWRDEVLVEHHHPTPSNLDPDHVDASGGNPPSYEALRTTDMLYVEYASGDREWYDLRSDPFELDNRYEQLDDASRAELHARLQAMQECQGASCRQADTPGP